MAPGRFDDLPEDWMACVYESIDQGRVGGEYFLIESSCSSGARPFDQIRLFDFAIADTWDADQDPTAFTDKPGNQILEWR
jgi:hypothetical protein